MVIRREPVAALIDADTTEPDAAARRRASAEEVFGPAAFSAPFRLILAVPCFEAILFSRPALLERAFGRELIPSDIKLGNLSPAETLAEFAQGSKAVAYKMVLSCLEPDDIASLRDSELVKGILELVEEVAISQVEGSAISTG